MSPFQIEQAMAAWASARARLLAEDAALEHDEAALIELLGPEQGTVEDVLDRLLRAAIHAEGMAGEATDRAAVSAARAKRYKARADALRGTAFAIFDAVGIRRHERPDFTASVRQGTASVVVTDEAALPEAFVRTTTAPDKAAIMAALKSGATVPGAELSNGVPSLSIRTR